MCPNKQKITITTKTITKITKNNHNAKITITTSDIILLQVILYVNFVVIQKLKTQLLNTGPVIALVDGAGRGILQ
jgi:hypothetical protein